MFLTTLIVCGFVTLFVGADTNEVQREFEKATTTEAEAKFCPAPKIGNECPSSSVLYYYVCCGDLNNECCLKPHMWVVVLLMALGVILLASVLLWLVRFIFCRRK
ncbi:hypothetical protein M3Y98_00361200 [Aphelenchoides besseyi]|nr:hypothetical protein M3Y98_00361200 [Aphelenchoides besseyi]KAI6201712.1 hypothetical protein M3Y96_00871600 [Aphelenchoides besseyi]